MRTRLLALWSCVVLVVVGVAVHVVSVSAADVPGAAGSVVEPGPLETVAGTGEHGHSGDGGPAVDAALGEVQGLAFDDAGNLYIASRPRGDERGAYIRMVAPDATISTVAGGPVVETDESAVDIASGGLAGVSGIDTGPDGELYIADGLVGQVMRLDPGEKPTVVAGTGEYGHAGDGGPATAAQLNTPVNVAVGNEGELYVADAGGYIRRIGADGVITTVAGMGETEASGGDGGPAVEASFARPMDVEVDADGNIYVADVTRLYASDGDTPSHQIRETATYPRLGTGYGDIPGHRIRKITPDGVIATIAGGEECGYTGDGGPAVDAELCYPRELAVGDDGTTFLVDEEHHQIRVISPDGSIDSLPTYIDDPSALAIGPDGALYVGDGDRGQVHRIPLDGDPVASDAPEAWAGVPDRWADADPRVVAAVAGTGSSGFSGDGGPALDAQLADPDDLAFGPDGTLYVLDRGNERIRAIEPDGTITTVAGAGGLGAGLPGLGPTEGDGRLASEVILGRVSGIDVASDGTLYMADSSNDRIRKVSRTGMLTTVAGTGKRPDENNIAAAGALATEVAFHAPHDVAVAPDRSLYVLDSDAHQVVHIGLDETVQVAAGTGSAGFSGDGGPAIEAELERPTNIDVGADGTLYIVDGGERVRAVGSDGVITTIGGKEDSEFGNPEYDDSTEGVRAIDVFLDIDGIAVDDAGTVYLGTYNSIQAIGPDGVITKLTASAGAAALAVDGSDNLYFSDHDQVSVLPKVSEDPVPVAADDEESGMQWGTVITGVLVAAGVAVVYGIRPANPRLGRPPVPHKPDRNR